MRAHADDLVAVLDHLGLDRAVLAGHSMGAYVATTAATAHPRRWSHVVLVDGGVALPLPHGVDPDDMLAGVLGPALARLEMTFADRAAYHAFWRAHPALDRAGRVERGHRGVARPRPHRHRAGAAVVGLARGGALRRPRAARRPRGAPRLPRHDAAGRAAARARAACSTRCRRCSPTS